MRTTTSRIFTKLIGTLILIIGSIFVVDSPRFQTSQSIAQDDSNVIFDNRSPEWSPQGDFIAFSSIRDGTQDIWIMQPDGTLVENLTANSTSEDTGPIWSPLGNKIVFFSDRAGQIDLWVIGIDEEGHADSEPINLTGAIDGNVLRPVWSPNGQYLAYLFSYSLEGAPSKLAVLRIDTLTNLDLPLDNHIALEYPSWSPDSTLIMCMAYNVDILSSVGIKLIDIDDNGQQYNFTHNPTHAFASWSPIDNRIAVVEKLPQEHYIWLMEITDAGDIETTNLTPDGSPFRVASPPIWSPDGNYIAFVSSDLNALRDMENENDLNGLYNTFDMWIMQTDGSHITNLTADTMNGFEPQWSPDGSQIAFTSTSSGRFDIWVMDIDGSNLTNLTSSD